MNVTSASQVERWFLLKQRQWAQRNEVPLADDRHTRTIDDNLFEQLSPGARGEFQAGAGGELSTVQGPADLSSLRSSAALCVNSLHSWRLVSKKPLASAFGVDGTLHGLEFEKPFGTGLGGTKPHLDASMRKSDGSTVAVEAKYLEPLGTPTRSFSRTYFTDRADWSGLPTVRAMAESIQASNPFSRLGAVQLIRHILGLRKQLGPDGFTLIYLYYDIDHDVGNQHRQEIDRFEDSVSPEVAFRAVTYQQLWNRVIDSEPTPGYLDYLFGRYGQQPIAPESREVR